MEQIPNLVFERDGTLPADVLAGLPAELRERLSSPEFVAQALEAIRQQVRKDSGLAKTGRRESSLAPIRMMFAHDGANRKARRRLQAALRG
jgi:hypothetical protein